MNTSVYACSAKAWTLALTFSFHILVQCVVQAKALQIPVFWACNAVNTLLPTTY